MTAAQAMKHKWIDSQLTDEEKQSQVVTKLSRRGERTRQYNQFMAMNKLKKVALADIACSLTKDEVGVLGEVFEKIDTDHDGRVTLHDLDEALAHGKFYFLLLHIDSANRFAHSLCPGQQ